MTTNWEIIEAINLAREVEKIVSLNGWHVGICGSILHTGTSYKDIDLFFYPHKTNESYCSIDNLFLTLSTLHIVRIEQRNHKTDGDDKLVFMCLQGKRRIDCFIFEAENKKLDNFNYGTTEDLT